MMSIKNNLHNYGHVNTGWAQRYQSDRTLNPNNMVCPGPDFRDNMGRPADRYSIFTETAGCTNATDRVYVEDSQRPKHFSSVSLNPLGIEGGYWCGDQELPIPSAARSAHLHPDNRAYYSQKMRDAQWVEMAEKIQYYKGLSGCL